VFDLFRAFPRAFFFKELCTRSADPSTLFFSLVIPLLQMVVHGLCIDNQHPPGKSVVFQRRWASLSRELIEPP